MPFLRLCQREAVAGQLEGSKQLSTHPGSVHRRPCCAHTCPAAVPPTHSAAAPASAVGAGAFKGRAAARPVLLRQRPAHAARGSQAAGRAAPQGLHAGGQHYRRRRRLSATARLCGPLLPIHQRQLPAQVSAGCFGEGLRGEAGGIGVLHRSHNSGSPALHPAPHHLPAASTCLSTGPFQPAPRFCTRRASGTMCHRWEWRGRCRWLQKSAQLSNSRGWHRDHDSWPLRVVAPNRPAATAILAAFCCNRTPTWWCWSSP